MSPERAGSAGWSLPVDHRATRRGPLGVLPGILIAVSLSTLNVFRRTWWPHHAELGRVEGIAGLHDTERYPHAELLPGLVIYRFDAPLIFASARMFGEALRAIAGVKRARR